MRVLQQRTRYHRTLIITTDTLQQRDPLGPELVTPAAGTTKAVRPAQQHQIIAAGLVGSEPTLEFGQIARIILHDP
jgi:hypothetical protein